MEKKNKLLIVITVVLVFVVATYFAFQNKQGALQTATEDDSVELTQDTAPAQVEGAVVTTPISYAQALIKYADRRIQLDKICQAHPNIVTYKDNTGIMIDNRSAETRTVKIGTTFTIKPTDLKSLLCQIFT